MSFPKLLRMVGKRDKIKYAGHQPSTRPFIREKR